jgi:hypothetical protein
MPILNRDSISYRYFQVKLQKYLEKFDSIEIIADWPDDIRYFCESLITGPGTMIKTKKELSFKIIRIDSVSKLPHNALADAEGIKETYVRSR